MTKLQPRSWKVHAPFNEGGTHFQCRVEEISEYQNEPFETISEPNSTLDPYAKQRFLERLRDQATNHEFRSGDYFEYAETVFNDFTAVVTKIASELGL